MTRRHELALTWAPVEDELTDEILVLSVFSPRSFLIELGQAPVCWPCTFLLNKPRKAIKSIVQEVHFAEVLL